jgi:hypothetical protein
MSGLLRRIKRSRAADAGEVPATGRAAGPEGAPTTAETSAGGDAATAASSAGERSFAAGDPSSAKTTELAAATPTGGDDARTDPEPAQPAAVPSSGRRGRFGRRLPGLRRRGATIEPPAAPPASELTAPALRRDPNTPAGLDPAAAAIAPPSGRRSRLRRRLRYLRRARELMLRDLGGLLYEVYRTAGGDVTAHSTLIGAKVERLSRLDAESEGIETALGAPRSETVVFQPGVGGICETCGELYGSAARFCSNCGSPTGPTAPTIAAPADASGEPRDDAAAPSGGDETRGDEVGGDSGPEAPDDQPQPASEQGHSPGRSNGRADNRDAPELSAGDPLAREGRS